MRKIGPYIRMWYRRIHARNLTAASFERAYARRSGASVAEVFGSRCYAKPCDCSEDGCDGWQKAYREDD